MANDETEETQPEAPKFKELPPAPELPTVAMWAEAGYDPAQRKPFLAQMKAAVAQALAEIEPAPLPAVDPDLKKVFKYLVKHGSHAVDKDTVVKAGETVDMTKEEFLRIDPKGHSLELVK